MSLQNDCWQKDPNFSDQRPIVITTDFEKENHQFLGPDIKFAFTMQTGMHLTEIKSKNLPKRIFLQQCRQIVKTLLWKFLG